MKRILAILFPLLVLGALVAGCGSSGPEFCREYSASYLQSCVPSCVTTATRGAPNAAPAMITTQCQAGCQQQLGEDSIFTSSCAPAPTASYVLPLASSPPPTIAGF